jgi:predicted SprT family Zn-dependent metalloprotease
MKLHLFALLFVLCFPLSGKSATQRSGAEYERQQPAPLPPNLEVSKGEYPLLEKLWRRSATFRRQCERIAEASWLKVRLSFNPRPMTPCGCRALTTVYHNKPLAHVRIFRLSDTVELIGHEFEHVLEQLEGLNLRTLVEAEDERVYRTEFGQFETHRAVQAGRQVRTEYNRAKRNEALMTEVVANRQAPIE